MIKEYSIDFKKVLTARELSVGELMVQGKTNKEIARELLLVPGTIKNISSRIIHKLNAANRVQAAVILCQSGIFYNRKSTNAEKS